jgi:GNAT superfamily N-acetyltransferase
VSDRTIVPHLRLKAADPPERRLGSAIFARAMGRSDPAVDAWLYGFSNLLAEAKIGHFLAAQYKDRVVAYGALIAYVKVGWIAFMATVPELQGKGIGSALLRGLMQLAQELGIRTLKLDATSIGIRLYSKYEFEEEYPVRRFEIPAQCGPDGGKRTDVKIALSIPEWCLAMDRQAFGDSRRGLLRLALKDGGKVLLVESHGFGILSGRRLGPIVSDSLDAAVDIVRKGGSLGANVIYVPLHPQMPEEFLAILKERESDGEITCCTRMKWGKPLREDLAKVFASHTAATG